MQGTGYLAIWSDLAPEDETDYLHWMTREHAAERVGVEGFLAMRLFRAIGTPERRYFILYELESADVVGGEGHVIHAIGDFGIRRRAITNPLSARHVAGCFARLNWRGRSKAQRTGIKFLHAVGIGRVERNMIDTGDVWARSVLGERDDREDCADE